MQLLIIYAVDIAQQIPEHATISIRPARRLAAIRANLLRSDRALGGSNQCSPHDEIEAEFILSAVLYSTADNRIYMAIPKLDYMIDILIMMREAKIAQYDFIRERIIKCQIVLTDTLYKFYK